MNTLLSKGNTNSKLAKNEKYGYDTSYILYLSPYKQNDKGKNVCPKASKGCISGCLFTAGLGVFSNVQKARIDKTNLLFSDRQTFLTMLWNELEKINKKAGKKLHTVPVRLNGTSDLDWIALFETIGKDPLSLENIIFYDYTKVGKRLEKYKASNYHLTFSRSESNENEAIDLLTKGHNVAVVFKKELPKTWNGFPVIDGDLNDLRFTDRRQVVVGLKAKGKARKDSTGFVVNYQPN